MSDERLTEVHVLHLLPDLAVGGGQVIVRNLVAEPVDGIVHHVAALGGGPMADAFAGSGASLWQAPRRGRLGPTEAACRLVGLVRGRGIDVVHTNNTPADRLVGTAVARATGRPTINTLMAIASSQRPRHPGEPLGSFGRRRAGNLANRVLARAATDRLVALSDTVRRAHAEALGLPCSRIDVVHPGVPSAAPAHPEQLAALRRELRLGDAYPVLLSVGRIEANKGQRDLVPMLARVVSRFPSARLLVAGDGEDREPLAVAMAAAGLDRHATVLGRRDDVAALAEVADMLLSTAHHEGFGMAVLEAMAAGCAVAAYDNDFVAIREFVTDGVSGRLVPEDPAALADAVVGLAADRARLVATGVAARDAAGRFSAARSAQRYGEIYRELALSRPARPHHRLPRKPGC